MILASVSNSVRSGRQRAPVKHNNRGPEFPKQPTDVVQLTAFHTFVNKIFAARNGAPRLFLVDYVVASSGRLVEFGTHDWLLLRRIKERNKPAEERERNRLWSAVLTPRKALPLKIGVLGLSSG